MESLVAVESSNYTLHQNRNSSRTHTREKRGQKHWKLSNAALISMCFVSKYRKVVSKVLFSVGFSFAPHHHSILTSNNVDWINSEK